ncbi:MAG TPA: 16S rRNA (guanine(527)-N(7))-methyltransferase RsmG [Dehalococcoidia bacterium]|nr:16S rRNA (guanine(527)-N(7))-methyltransferase RsmG [Dehalococcoidia bacterium]
MDSATEVCKQLRNRLSSVEDDAFDLYYRRLVEARGRANLTSLRDRESIERRLFLESIVLLRTLEEAGVVWTPVIDIGTGAGIPGIPVKIVRPDLEMTLLEATGKKARFVEETVKELGLSDVQVIHGRAEELAREQAHRESYALALARAVGPLRMLVELALPFLRIGGCLAAPKGSGAAREVREAAKALSECGGTVESVRTLDMLGPGPKPTLVLVRKTAATPERYPRRTGVPRKRPL